MKCIAKTNLQALLTTIPYMTLDIDDFQKLLEKYGDDWFIVDGHWELCERNKNMVALLKEAMKND